MPPGAGVKIGHEASTLACEYGPQWMNMPNLQSLNRRSRAAALASGPAHSAEPAVSIPTIRVENRIERIGVASVTLSISCLR